MADQKPRRSAFADVITLDPVAIPIELSIAVANALKLFRANWDGQKANRMKESVDDYVDRYAAPLARAHIEPQDVPVAANACLDVCTYFPKPSELLDAAREAKRARRARIHVAPDTGAYWSGHVDAPCPTCQAWPIIRELPCPHAQRGCGFRRSEIEVAYAHALHEQSTAGVERTPAAETAASDAAARCGVRHAHYEYDAPDCACCVPEGRGRSVGMHCTPFDVQAAYRAQAEAPPVAAAPEPAGGAPRLQVVR